MGRGILQRLGELARPEAMAFCNRRGMAALRNGHLHGVMSTKDLSRFASLKSIRLHGDCHSLMDLRRLVALRESYLSSRRLSRETGVLTGLKRLVALLMTCILWQQTREIGRLSGWGKLAMIWKAILVRRSSMCGRCWMSFGSSPALSGSHMVTMIISWHLWGVIAEDGSLHDGINRLGIVTSFAVLTRLDLLGLAERKAIAEIVNSG